MGYIFSSCSFFVTKIPGESVGRYSPCCITIKVEYIPDLTDALPCYIINDGFQWLRCFQFAFCIIIWKRRRIFYVSSNIFSDGMELVVAITLWSHEIFISESPITPCDVVWGVTIVNENVFNTA